MGVEGPEDAIKSLKTTGAWGMLEHVVIEGCDLVDYDTAVKIIGKQKLRFVKRIFARAEHEASAVLTATSFGQ